MATTVSTKNIIDILNIIGLKPSLHKYNNIPQTTFLIKHPVFESIAADGKTTVKKIQNLRTPLGKFEIHVHTPGTQITYKFDYLAPLRVSGSARVALRFAQATRTDPDTRRGAG